MGGKRKETTTKMRKRWMLESWSPGLRGERGLLMEIRLGPTKKIFADSGSGLPASSMSFAPPRSPRPPDRRFGGPVLLLGPTSSQSNCPCICSSIAAGRKTSKPLCDGIPDGKRTARNTSMTQLFGDERCTAAILEFLGTTEVGLRGRCRGESSGDPGGSLESGSEGEGTDGLSEDEVG
jgi:hypothetical protein